MALSFIKADALGEHFCRVHSLDRDKVLPIEYVDPAYLVRSTRLDLPSKITYAKEYIKGTLTNQAILDYKSFIGAFSSNTFAEGDGSKSSFKEFKTAFEHLIDSIRNNGFDPKHAVPVGENNTIIGGAHRTAIMVALKQHIPIVRIDGLVANYDANYFKERDVADEVIEASLTRLANYIEGSVFMLWPSMTSKQQKLALDLIKGKGHVIYQREDYFNFEGLHALVAMTYIEHSWVGTPIDRYSGAINKAKQISGKLRAPLITLLVEGGGSEAAELKLEIRDALNCGNAGVHCTDNNKETVYLLNILLNTNTRHLLIKGRPFHFKKYIDSVMQYRQKIINNKLSVDDFCIVSSGVLGLYGLRLPNDIDFLSLSDNYNSILDENIESHHHVIVDGAKRLELIDHPVNYIRFFDIKIIAPKAFISTNNCRREKTKINDIAQINMLLRNKEGGGIFYRCKSRCYQLLRKVRSSRFGINFFLYFVSQSPILSPVYRQLKRNKLMRFLNNQLSVIVNKMPKW